MENVVLKATFFLVYMVFVKEMTILINIYLDI